LPFELRFAQATVVVRGVTFCDVHSSKTLTWSCQTLLFKEEIQMWPGLCVNRILVTGEKYG
jgi:hypothetical protein